MMRAQQLLWKVIRQRNSRENILVWWLLIFGMEGKAAMLDEVSRRDILNDARDRDWLIDRWEFRGCG